MELATLLGIAFVGSIIWFMPVSATSFVYGTELGWNPLLVGLVCATGQSFGYAILYYGGGWLERRWSYVSRKVEETRTRYGARLEQGYLGATALGGVTGAPPMVALAALAQAFGVGLPRFLLVAFPARATRFAFMAGLGQALAALFGF